MADDEQTGQDEIENLLNQAQEADAPGEEPALKTAGKEGILEQGEIEALVRPGESSESGVHARPAPSTPVAAKTATDDSAPADSPRVVSQRDVEVLLNQAQEAIASIDGGTSNLPPGATSFEFKDFAGTPASKDGATLELVRDVELDLKIELGRTHLQLEDVLRLQKGAVVALDKLAGDPVDIYVNGRLIARGEVLVLNDNFCVRVAELIVGESACA